MSCSNIFLGSSERSQIEAAANKMLGQHENFARDNFPGSSQLNFTFIESLNGRSGQRYNLFSANEGGVRILVAFELEDEIVSQLHIRSYTNSYPDVDENIIVPAQCFLSPEGYFEFVQRQFPIGATNIDRVLSSVDDSGLVLHRESNNAELREMIFLQRPFPSGSFEEVIGGNISPNIPNGFCVVFDQSSGQISEYKMPYQCNVDMALLSSQLEEQIGEGN